MTNGSVLYAFQNLYEPVQNGTAWVVHYKQNNKWFSETCVTREQAVAFYQKKDRELRAFYNRFLRELGAKK